MTQEEKAKAYDEALQRTRRFYDSNTNEGYRAIFEDIFPELKESEDEIIRKELIAYHRSMAAAMNGNRPCVHEAWIAWLEKKGGIDNCPLEYSTNTVMTDSKKNQVEPKFKVGDWIVYNRDDYSREIIQVYDIRDGRYYFTDNVHFSWSIKECDEKSHLWTIQDAKDGDVLVYKDEISLYKHDINNCTNQETTFGGFVFHCCYDGKRFIMDSLYSLTEQDKMDIQPATKEQRDLLFAKMNEAGYEWDADKKELSKRVIDEGKSEMDYCFTKMMNGEKVSPIWSEDDERILEEVKFNFESNKEQMTPALMECYEKFFNKIKHLIPQNDKQELSGEDETAIDVLINLVKMPYGNYIDFSAKNRLLNWLIALKGRITQYLLVNYG